MGRNLIDSVNSWSQCTDIAQFTLLISTEVNNVTLRAICPVCSQKSYIIATKTELMTQTELHKLTLQAYKRYPQSVCALFRSYPPMPPVNLLCRCSRRIMWLEVRSTNKDAAVIADHFLDYVC